MKTSRQHRQVGATGGTSRWPGYIFGGLGGLMFAAGLGLTVDRMVIFHTWPEVAATVRESRIETSGSQYSAVIGVEFDFRGRKIESRPSSDYRASRYAWIAEAVERHPIGSTTLIRHHWD